MSATPNPNGPSFVKARQEELPPWLADVQGRGFHIAFGAQEDLELSFEVAGVEQRWPTSCADDALDAVGVGFQLDRYPNESHDHYRARLLEAWPTWLEGGTEQAIIDQLHAYGVNDVRIYRENEGGRWAMGDWYSRFWVILGPDMPWKPLVPPFTGGLPVTGGSTATPQEIEDVKAIILKWKSYWSYPVKVVLDFSWEGFTVPLGGDLLTPPFDTWPFDPTPIPRCEWRIGKCSCVPEGGTLYGPPFTPGGYFFPEP